MKTKGKAPCLQVLLGLGLVGLLCALPYANNDLAAGHDALFHILRIEGLARELCSGAGWPSRVYSLLCGGYGYASGLFYPDLFLLLPAALRAWLVGPELAFKLFLLLCAVAAAFTAYLAGRGICHSHRAGLLLLVLYGLGHYHLANLFIRSAVGEVQAMVFVPLVLWGLWDLTEEGFQKPWLLCLAFAGLMLSHTISLALCGLFALGWVLVRLPRVLRPRTLLAGCLCVAVCLGLTCYFWLPMLEQFADGTFKVSGEPLTYLRFNTITAAELVQPSCYMGLGLSGLVLAAGGLAAGFWRWRSQGGRQAAFGLAMTLTGILLALATLRGLSAGLWAALDQTLLTSIQFPWRLGLLGQLCLALGLVYSLLPWLEGERQGARPWPALALALAAALALGAADLACLWGQLPELCNYPENYFEARSETFYLVGQEWAPLEANLQELAAEPAARYTDAEGAHTGQYLPDGSFVYREQGTPGLRGIPKLYYKGYTAWLTQDDGEVLPLELHKDGAGRVELTIPEGAGSGTVTVVYTGTPLQTAANGISLVTLLACAIGGGWAGAHRKKTRAPR